MVRYEVVAEVAPELVDRYREFMRSRHFPDILATGCFVRIGLDRASATRFRSRYEARTRADVDRYLAEHTARLRADFAAHFPTGVTLTREIWEEIVEMGE
jgi:hypothetical protein